jgi:hypothetical protein
MLRRWQADPQGLIQVRFSAAGCMQLDDLTGATGAVAELAYFLLVAGAFGCVAWLTYEKLTHGIGWIGYAVCLAITVGIAVVVLKEFRKRKLLRSQLPDSARAQLARRLARLTPWNKIGDVIWHSIGENLIRVRLRSRTPWYGLVSEPIDAELKCDAESASRIQLVVDEWIGTARKN